MAHLLPEGRLSRDRLRSGLCPLSCPGLPATTVGSPGAPPVRGRLPGAAAMLSPGVDLPLSTVDVAEKRELLRSAGFEAWDAGDENRGLALG